MVCVADRHRTGGLAESTVDHLLALTAVVAVFFCRFRIDSRSYLVDMGNQNHLRDTPGSDQKDPPKS
jgi:hypothetical protein